MAVHVSSVSFRCFEFSISSLGARKPRGRSGGPGLAHLILPTHGQSSRGKTLQFCGENPPKNLPGDSPHTRGSGGRDPSSSALIGTRRSSSTDRAGTWQSRPRHLARSETRFANFTRGGNRNRLGRWAGDGCAQHWRNRERGPAGRGLRAKTKLPVPLNCVAVHRYPIREDIANYPEEALWLLIQHGTSKYGCPLNMGVSPAERVTASQPAAKPTRAESAGRGLSPRTSEGGSAAELGHYIVSSTHTQDPGVTTCNQHTSSV